MIGQRGTLALLTWQRGEMREPSQTVELEYLVCFFIKIRSYRLNESHHTRARSY
jgi:hypothetical protein